VPVHPPLILRALLLALLFAAGIAKAEDRPGDFDFYVLALSWTPGYCDTAGNPDPAQCATGQRHGFLVHGLWPQYERGYPEFCASGPQQWLADETVAAIRHVMPSASLARYQWHKHGRCSGLSEADYFALLVEAAESIAVPVPLSDGGMTVSPTAIENAFVAANPRLSQNGMSVQCRRGAFTEIRICLTKDLAFRDCPEVDADTCRAGSITMPAR
jgi:ribonuclease T2